MKRIATFLVLAWAACTLALALPTAEQVRQEVQAGRYDQAAQMMRQVVEARPGSARAHYVYAEILAHQGRVAQAVEQARLARAADPAIGFTEPAKFEAFERALQQRAQGAPAPQAAAAAQAAPAPEGGGMPGWVWVAGGVAVALLLWRLLARRGAPAGMVADLRGPTAAATTAAPPWTPGAAGPGHAPRSAIGAGMAAAGGFAAGMLADRLLRDHDAPAAAHAVPPEAGGLTPGFFDDAHAAAPDEPSERPIDFGSGGDDWGGGGDDAGGGGGDDGW